MRQISVFLPDGSEKTINENCSALNVAESISAGLAKNVVAAVINGKLCDLQDKVNDQDSLEFLKANDPRALEVIRHSCEHLLAASVCKLFKNAQVTMGPKNHDKEFYYDFDIGRAFTPDDLVKIENEMKKLIKDKISFTKKTIDKQQAYKIFEELRQKYKKEIIDWIPEDSVSIYQCGDFIDLCRGPHLPHAGFIKAFKLMANSGSYWRGNCNNEMLQRITGVAFSSNKELQTYLNMLSEAEKRDHRKLGKELELFSVSETFDRHEFSDDNHVEVFIEASLNESLFAQDNISRLIKNSFFGELSEILAPKKIKISACNLTTHKDKNLLDYDILIKILSSSLSSKQKKALDNFKASLGDNEQIQGKIRFAIENKYKEEIGPGLVSWLPKGARIRTLIENFWQKKHFDGGYEIVYSPHIAKSDLWRVSGHWGFYQENMFAPMNVDGQQYILKPMNCPFHILMFKNKMRSYRELPIRMAEMGTVYRYELAGVLHGLMRARGFTQDDAHIFCRWDQLDQEIDRVINFVLDILKTFGFEEFEINVSTRPEEFVGDIKQWNDAEKALIKAVKRCQLPYEIDEGGGAFYGPKIDVKLKDCLGRMWQCSTIQLDFNNPKRFDLSFINNNGQKEQPVMIHRALFGSLERFFGILIEQYAGAFPGWLAPEQIRVIPITDKNMDFAQEIKELLLNHDLRVDIAHSNDKLGAKIRQAQMDKIPIMLIVGDSEQEKQGVSVRLRNSKDAGFVNKEKIAQYCLNKVAIT